MKRNSRGSVWNRSDAYVHEKSVTGSIGKEEVRCGSAGGGVARQELIALAELVTSSF